MLRTRFVLVIGALAIVLVTSGMAGGPAIAQITFAEIVERLNQVNPILQTFVVQQVADIRVFWIFSFRVHATMYAARPANYKVVIHDPPAFLQGLGDTFSAVSSPEELLANYRATAVRSADDRHLLLELQATGPHVNPPTVTGTIDTTRWIVEELLLKYDWGDVDAKYHYELVEGHLLPVAIQVWAGAALQAHLTFLEYQLNVPLPPDIFGRDQGGGN